MKLSERIRNIEVNGKEGTPSIVQAERSEIADEVAQLKTEIIALRREIHSLQKLAYDYIQAYENLVFEEQDDES